MPKSIHDLILPRIEYKEFDKDGVQTFSLELDTASLYMLYPYVGSGENGYLLNLGKVSKDRYPLKCIVYVDGKPLSCDSEKFKRQAREVEARYEAVKKNISDAINNAASLNESMSSSEAEDFKKKLKDGEVKFKYMKKDGSERTAIGTLKPELMDLPEKKTSSDVDKASENQKKKRKLPADSVFYYDLEAKGFRSFKMSNFVDYI